MKPLLYNIFYKGKSLGVKLCLKSLGVTRGQLDFFFSTLLFMIANIGAFEVGVSMISHVCNQRVSTSHATPLYTF